MFFSKSRIIGTAIFLACGIVAGSGIAAFAQSNPSSKGKTVLGYATYYSTEDTVGYNSLKAHSSLINELATHTYVVKSDGNITCPEELPASQMALAKKKGVSTLAVVRNDFDAELAHQVLGNKTKERKLISSIEKELKSRGYKGVNIDFECMNSVDRNAFSTFIKDLYQQLHSKGYLVTVAVQAKTQDDKSEYWVYAFDYKEIGKYCDQVVVMTYDEHYIGGDAGPIASIGWVQQVANYATSVMPKSKVLVGLATYGYDWNVTKGTATDCGTKQAYSIAAKYKSKMMWDNKAKVPYFTYKDSEGSMHKVYFENSQSVGYKLDLVNKSKLGGVAIWRIGLEDDSFWTTIKTKLNK